MGPLARGGFDEAAQLRSRGRRENRRRLRNSVVSQKGNIMFRTSIFGIFLTSVFLASCGGGGEGLDDEDIEQSASALCTDNAALAVSEVLTIGDVGGSVEVTSPSSRYGNSACP